MPTSNAKKQGILQQASDWILQADLDKKQQFPKIVQTSLRPVIQSTATKCLVIVEGQYLGRKGARAHMN